VTAVVTAPEPAAKIEDTIVAYVKVAVGIVSAVIAEAERTALAGNSEAGITKHPDLGRLIPLIARSPTADNDVCISYDHVLIAVALHRWPAQRVDFDVAVDVDVSLPVAAVDPGIVAGARHDTASPVFGRAEGSIRAGARPFNSRGDIDNAQQNNKANKNSYSFTHEITLLLNYHHHILTIFVWFCAIMACPLGQAQKLNGCGVFAEKAYGNMRLIVLPKWTWAK
jgi:hypothetical protein